MQHQTPKYKKVTIQKLQDRPQRQLSQKRQKDLIVSLDKSEQYRGKGILFYQDSGIGSERIIQPNGQFTVSHFFNAFAHAYTQHGDIVLVPDEIWIMIAFFMSKYIDSNAEKLRKNLVKHEGVKVLVVRQQVDLLQEAVELEKNWDVFFDQIIKTIKKETIPGVVEDFECNFSTTTKTYQVISTSIIMNSMKKFFKYERSIGCACGINNVYMAGTREDWAKMIPKLEKMVQYDVDGEIKEYVSHMRVILKQFLNTYDDKPDVDWWNTIMTTPEKRIEYFSEEMKIEGWILNFFGMYEDEVLSGFPRMDINVPILLQNQWTKKQKQLTLIADWVSVSKIDDRTYKPDVGVGIFVEKMRQLKL